MTAAAVESKEITAAAPLTMQPPPTVDPAAYTDDAPEFSAVVRTALAVPVDPELVETRSAGGDRELQFVPWVHYQDVLLKAFGPGGYRLVPRGPARTEGNVMTYTAALFVRDRGSAKFQFIKEAKGECGLHGGMTPGNAAEGAQSDCLVKCCKALGIFMELFDPRWRRAWEAKYRNKHKQQMGAAQWPAARAGAQSAAAVGTSPTASTAPTPSPAPSSSSTAEPATEAAPSDTGEPASDEAKTAIRGQVKRLAWKADFARKWLASHFGVQSPDALSQAQADNVYLLLNSHGTAVYDKLLADLQSKGEAK